MEGRMSDDGLTEHGLECLEHLKQARALGASVAEYARTHGLKARTLYDAIRTLKKKGVLAEGVAWHRRGGLSAESQSERGASGFVSVQVERPNGRSCPSLPVLRFRHVRGHVLEFGIWPPADVLGTVLSGGCDAAA
jgi:hypothetical protein